jgi:plasmid replication initiation protein
MTALLAPDRYPIKDFFVLDLADVTPRDDMASMEHPIFGLTPTASRRELVYRNGENVLRIVPSAEGVPSIFDKDLLIYCVSQLMARKNRGEPIGPEVEFHAYDVLRATNRRTDGREYRMLLSSMRRLAGAVIETTIRTTEAEVTNGFHLIESYGIVRSEPITGRMIKARVTLSDWMMRAIEADEVLELHPKYFQLRRPLDRRLYEIARKHCGRQDAWQIGLEKLQLKTGSNAPLKKFRFNVRQVEKSDHLPEYAFNVVDDVVTVSRRAETAPPVAPRPRPSSKDQAPPARVRREEFVSAAAMERVREVAPGWDKYWLENRYYEWRKGKEAPESIDAAFLGWAKSFTKGKPPQ